jgi:hypothetical protein
MVEFSHNYLKLYLSIFKKLQGYFTLHEVIDKNILCLCLASCFILPLLFAYFPFDQTYGQAADSQPADSPLPLTQEWIKIVKPLTGSKATIEADVEVSGESSDTTQKDCQVSVIVNNVKPYQSASVVNSDFAKWRFNLHDNYTKLNEGENKITAKLSCSIPQATRWYSVFVTVPNSTQRAVTTESTKVESVTAMDSKKNTKALSNLEAQTSSLIATPSPFTSTTTTTNLKPHDTTTPTEKNSINLVAASDYGCNSVTADVVNKMKEKNPDLVLAIGDLSEVKDPSCFFNLFSNLEGKMKIALGEHDTDSNQTEDSSSRFSQYAKHFNLDEPYYSFNYKNVHFLAMSTGKDEFVPFGIGSPQYNFVVNDLDTASKNKDIDWIIVYGYRPFYSSPTVHPGPKTTRDIYHPLFEKYGVDLVINGHNHNYQRTYPLKLNAVSLSNPIVTDRNNSNYINPDGPIFVTVGTAGNELYDLSSQYPFVATQFKRNGFLDLEVSNDGTELIGSFFDSTDDIEEGDTFTISKF